MFTNLLKTPEFYEIMGAIYGDGHIKYYPREKKKRYEITISGNIKEDVEYLQKLQKKLKMFLGLKTTLIKRKKYNVAYLCFNSKEFVELLVKTLKIGAGKDKNKRGIPQVFLKQNKRALRNLARGLIDTDGCLVFSKKGTYKRYCYPVIEIKAGKVLMGNIYKILRSIGFKPRIRRSETKDYCIYLSGKKQLEKWIDEVGFSNPKHESKYLVWKQTGECQPRTTLSDRKTELYCGGSKAAMHPFSVDTIR